MRLHQERLRHDCRRISAEDVVLLITLQAWHHAGEDKKVALWQTEDWKVTEQSKPLPKGAAQSVLFTHHGAAACGEEPCLLLVRRLQLQYNPLPCSSVTARGLPSS